MPYGSQSHNKFIILTRDKLDTVKVKTTEVWRRIYININVKIKQK